MFQDRKNREKNVFLLKKQRFIYIYHIIFHDKKTNLYVLLKNNFEVNYFQNKKDIFFSPSCSVHSYLPICFMFTPTFMVEKSREIPIFDLLNKCSLIYKTCPISSSISRTFPLDTSFTKIDRHNLIF
jgi:hypothetical protein